ncbi:MAG: molybdate ABC transporter substrate-binding protein [Cyanobacteria bacterium P01_G01_bin.54]
MRTSPLRPFPHPLSLKWLFATLLVCCLSIGCHALAPEPATIPLTVSAAASLQDVLTAIAPAFQTAHPKLRIEFNFAASGTLQQQIAQGAPVDLFFSAAAPQMDALEQQGLVRPETRRELLTNHLVLITAQASPLRIQAWEQLKTTTFEHLVVGEFRTVPAGQYAQQALKNLALFDAVQPKLVFSRNVRSVLATVEQGNAELGLVYATDAALGDRVRILLPVPTAAHPPIRYPIAVLQASEHPKAAEQWIAFLQSDMAQMAFRDFGFMPLP